MKKRPTILQKRTTAIRSCRSLYGKKEIEKTKEKESTEPPRKKRKIRIFRAKVIKRKKRKSSVNIGKQFSNVIEKSKITNEPKIPETSPFIEKIYSELPEKLPVLDGEDIEEIIKSLSLNNIEKQVVNPPEAFQETCEKENDVRNKEHDLTSTYLESSQSEWEAVKETCPPGYKSTKKRTLSLPNLRESTRDLKIQTNTKIKEPKRFVEKSCQTTLPERTYMITRRKKFVSVGVQTSSSIFRRSRK